MTAELIITDGSTYIDLLNHFTLLGWQPSAAEFRDGGIMQTSPVGDGGRIVGYYYDTITDTFPLAVKAGSQNSAISDLRRLRQLIQRAIDFWAGWSTNMVWIEARGPYETDRRYSIVVNANLPQDPDPYSMLFGAERMTGSSIGVVQLGIMHSIWQSTIPGQNGETVSVGERQLFAGRYYGNIDGSNVLSPVSDWSSYVANKQNNNNITHVIWATTGGPYTNIQAGAFPANLLESGGFGVGDAIYFGIDTTWAGAGPFSSLVFPMSTIAGIGYTFVWEYWNGAAWAAFSSGGFYDGTDGFQRSGVTSIHFRQPPTWATVNLATVGVTAWWIRARLSAVPGAPQPIPAISGRIYTASWGYNEIQAGEISGDIPAVVRAWIANISDSVWKTASDYTDLGSTRIIGGLRSVSRGVDFQAYLNCSSIGNPAGVVFTPSALDTPTVDGSAITGIGYDFNYAVDFFFSSTIAKEYQGQFRAFLRVKQNSGSVGDLGFYLYTRWGRSTPVNGNIIFPTTAALDYQLLDMGIVNLLPTMATGEQPALDITGAGVDSMIISIQIVRYNSFAGSFKIHDLILIPYDEWEFDAVQETPVARALYSQYPNRTYLDIDPMINPKILRANMRTDVDNSLISAWRLITVGDPILQANSRQRLWLLSEFYDLLTGKWRSEPYVVSNMKLFKSERFKSMRGNI